MKTAREKYLACQHRYNVSEKGRARHSKYNASEKGRLRWLRYEDGYVGTEHRWADHFRRLAASIERDQILIEELMGKSELTTRAVRHYVPKYNEARKKEALDARLRELGWDWRYIGEPLCIRGQFLNTPELVPVREHAVPREVLHEVLALWRISGTENFSRRTRVHAPPPAA